uniref:Huntingtin n=1 Tax=Ciona savignyi TaxID=51511 RepID=H2ZNB7_CIOSA
NIAMEKLVKSVNALKFFHGGLSSEDKTQKDSLQSPTERQNHCNIITDSIISQSIRSLVDFPGLLAVSVETLLQSCADENADVRLNSNECLNRVIKGLYDVSVSKILVELYKEIKKNGHARSLRAALKRFSYLSPNIRSNKCRPYILNLLPCLCRISQREEDAVQEVLSSSLAKIFIVLGAFASESEIQGLLASFLKNLSHKSPTVRRTACICLHSILTNSRKKNVVIGPLVHSIIDILLQRSTDRNTVLGCLQALRILNPLFKITVQGKITDNQVLKQHRDLILKVVLRLTKAFDACIFYLDNTDHTIVTATLELLDNLLSGFPSELSAVLTKVGALNETSFTPSATKMDIVQDKSVTRDEGWCVIWVIIVKKLLQVLLKHKLFSECAHCSVTGAITFCCTCKPITSIAYLFNLLILCQNSCLAPSVLTREQYISDMSPSPGLVVRCITANISSLSSLASSTIEEKISGIRHVPLEDTKTNQDDPLLPHNNNSAVKNTTALETLQTNAVDGETSSKTDVVHGETSSKIELNNQTDKGAVESELNNDKSADGVVTQTETSKLLPISDLYGNSKQLPLVTLTRLLCQRFLVNIDTGELLPDKQVRVSNKNLAMNTLSQIIKIYPSAICYPIQDIFFQVSEVHFMTNVLQCSKHSDPKLRGSSITLASFLIDAVITTHRCGFESWVSNVEKSTIPALNCPTIDELSLLICDGLIDESSTTSRQACSAVTSCVNTLLNSECFTYGLHLLHCSMELHTSTYWLIKVGLLELLASINYRQVVYLESLTSENSTQIKQKSIAQKALSIALECLCDEDTRLRKTSSAAIVSMATSYPTPNDDDLLTSEAVEKSRKWMGGATEVKVDEEEGERSSDAGSPKSLLKTYRGYEIDGSNSGSIADSLSYIVGEVSTLLTNSWNKHQTFGCILALKELSMKYTVASYPTAWGCFLVDDESFSSFLHRLRTASNESGNSSQSTDSKSGTKQVSHILSQQQFGILPIVMSLLRSAWLPLDVTAHSDALVLAGNLIAGASSNVPIEDQSFEKVSSKTLPSADRNWATLHDTVLGSYANQLFTHLTKLTSIMHHVISDITPLPPNKSVLPNIAPSAIPSPMKRREKPSNEPNKPSPPLTRKLLPSSPLTKPGFTKEVRKNPLIGSFHTNRVLMKLHEQLAGSYRNYKGSLDFGADDRFCSFMSGVLDVQSQMLELAVFQDIGSYTEEILSYMKSLFTIDPTLTIQSVQQLLKALFGTNLVNNLVPHDETHQPPKSPSSPLAAPNTSGFYHQIFHHPLNHLTMAIANSSFHHSLQSKSPVKDNDGWFGSIKKKVSISVERKLNDVSKNSKSNKSSIQNYIRLFESLVIKSLKLYTVTSSVEFQKHVLNLLAQLVQLRVNYCMLDSDQVFINFIIKQFESIEGGMVRGSESLIPHVFFFLVLLSYERYHSKSVITMSKIIQLCDGLMASEQGSASHVIPAMQPITHDIFVVRGSLKNEPPEVTTQREVVQFMMLKLLQHPQVYKMMITILMHCRRDNMEKWKKYSRQVADVVLPMLGQLKIEVTCHDDISTLHSLFEALSPTALRPISLLIDLLLRIPKSLRIWLASVLVLLRVLICQAREQDILDNVDVNKVKVQTMTCSLFEHLQSGSHPTEEAKEMIKLPSAETLAIFFHQLIGSSCSYLLQFGSNPGTKNDESSQILLSQQINELLLSLTYIHRSGSFKNFTAACKKLSESSNENFFSHGQMAKMFESLSHVHPMLTVMWAQYLSYFMPVQTEFWKRFTSNSSLISILLHSASEESSHFALNRNLVKTGCLILLADYTCQNSNQHHLSLWLTENHVYDITMMRDEPPVQDFISSLHQDATESKCFVEALSKHLGTHQKFKPSFALRILHCLTGVSTKSSQALISLLLSPKFVLSPVRTVFAASQQLLQTTVENVLKLSREDAVEIINTEFAQNLVVQVENVKEKPQYPTICHLIGQLHDHVTGNQPITTQKPNVNIQLLLEKPNKEWFKYVVLSCLQENHWSPECAGVLAHVDEDDITEIQSHPSFTLQHLTSCIHNGIHEVTSVHGALTPYPEDKTRYAVASRVKSIRKASTTKTKNAKNKIFTENETNIFDDVNFNDDLMWLNESLVLMYRHHPMLPTQYQLPTEHYKHYLTVSMLGLQAIGYQINSGEVPSLQKTMCALESLQQALFVKPICSMLINEEFKWLKDCVRIVFNILQMYIGKVPYTPPYLPSDYDKEVTSSIYNDPSNPLSSCIKLSQMLAFFRSPHENGQIFREIPSCVMRPLNNILLHLATAPLFKDYIRAPPIVWKYGWNPPLGGDSGTSLPEIPSDFLQEKEVLQEYISIVNQMGWTKRAEFEETWTTLLGVLVSQPVVPDDSSSEVSFSMRSEISSLAIRGLTSLVVDCALHPDCGRKATSKFQVYHRHSAFKLAHTKVGRQLLKVRGILEDESWTMTKQKTNQDTHHNQHVTQNETSSSYSHEWISTNMERILSPSTYGLAQNSVRSFHVLHGITPVKEDFYDGDYDSASDNSLSNANPQPPPLSPLRIRDGVDVHSCVQFLLELYTEWFRTAAQANQNSPSVARPLLCECVRSLLLISDLFTEKHQFEWMLTALTTLQNSQPLDDDVLMQYLTPAICKAASVLGMTSEMAENVLRVLEPSLSSTLLSCRTSALVGLLQCIETHPSPNLRPIVDLGSQFIPPNFVAVSSCPSLFNEEYVVLLATVAFYLIEKCHDAVMPEFTAVVIQASLLIISSRDDTSVPNRVFHAVVHGLQRLVLSFSLSAPECDSILKVAAEHLHTNPWMSRATAVCGLMMTCMYCGDSNPDHPSTQGGSPEHEDAVETRLLAMERVSLLFDRIRKGYPQEARVMSKILPSMLDDFFPAQEIMNKIIAEFISTLQPFPGSVAHILYEVFQSLHERDQSHLVQGWVMLSLGNAIQRTPLHTAVWCLTCLFASASTNRWISSMVPLIISRSHDPSLDRNWTCFCKSAVDFYTCQLSEELDRRSFHAIFSTSSSSGDPASPYQLLLDSISRINGEQGI